MHEKLEIRSDYKTDLDIKKSLSIRIIFQKVLISTSIF